jgi:hypothetical protein
VERLKNFAIQRNDFMKEHIRSFFALEDNVQISVTNIPTGAGNVRLNGVNNNTDFQEAFYYRNIPFEVNAEPAPGYVFSHYKIRKKEATNLSLISSADQWRYFDQGTLPSTEWKNVEYTDAAWAIGQAELGYGDGDEETVVAAGPAADKYITTYFRKAFTVDDTTGLEALSGRVLFDDGVVVYFNGEEVYRSNLPAGEISNSTLATNQVAETTFFSFVIAKGKIKPGTNVIAVEVHQTNNISSDVSFNLDLSTIRTGAETEATISTANVSDIANSNVTIEAFFVPVSPISGLVINEVAAGNTLFLDSHGESNDWVEIYNNGTTTVDLANVFVSDNVASKLKHRISSGKNNETLIAPGEYKILWADDDIEQGALHLNFKLSADGEEFGLYQKVGTSVETLDEVIFTPQLPFSSFSRIPNVTGSFTLTGRQTPLGSNIFELPVSTDEQLMESFSIYPNPLHGSFRVRSEFPVEQLQLYNATGARIFMVHNVRPQDEISMEGFPSGMYLAKVIMNGKAFMKKLIKL